MKGTTKRNMATASGTPENVSEQSLAVLRWLARLAIARMKKLKRAANGQFLRLRWSIHRRPTGPNAPLEGEEALQEISIVVINLDRRADRLAEFAEEMQTLGINDWQRIVAVDGKVKYGEIPPFFAGSIACSESHIEALASSNWSTHRGLMICEDDLKFVADRAEVSKLIGEFLADPRLSVLCLSGRARGGSFPISKRLRIAMGIVGRGCYIVKPEVTASLREHFSAGVPELMLGNRKGKGDQKWQRLQRRRFFFAMPRTTVAQQGAGYSDIEDSMLGPR